MNGEILLWDHLMVGWKGFDMVGYGMIGLLLYGMEWYGIVAMMVG